MKILVKALLGAIFMCVCYAQEYLGMAQSLVAEQVSNAAETQAESLLARAGAGDAMAARQLSAYYLSLGGGEASAALPWAVRAAEGGDAAGAMNAGICYYAGVGTAQDYARAAEWFEKSVEMGHNRALNPLSYLYAEGLGVKQDVPHALQLAERACAMQVPHAAERLAEFYFKGQGVPKDLNRAETILKNR